jgi:class 3 adenylate cyclase/pimeloyl-ACP methyl ester carboxylesterase
MGHDGHTEFAAPGQQACVLDLPLRFEVGPRPTASGSPAAWSQSLPIGETSMTRRPETRYAWNGDVALAYQVFGAGPVDLVYMQGYTSHVDLNWESPHLARFLRGLGERARVIHADRRGWGCSDRFSPGDVAPLEVQVDDLVALMDAAGSERAVIFGSVDTCPTAILFAATYPDRTAGLVLVDPVVAFYDSEEARREWAEINDRVRREWGTPAYDREYWSDERAFLDWFVPWCRASVAPGALAAESDRYASVDVRGVLSSVQVPTLVVGDLEGGDHVPTFGRLEGGEAAGTAQLVAERITGARLIEPAGEGGAGWFHWYQRAPAILAAIGDLISGIREEQESFDRVLATVLFTDMVDSTAAAARLGDAGWRTLVERHRATVRNLLARYRGTEVDTAGDGFFATFDGPARAARCATAIVEAMRPLGVKIRAGVHTGEVETIGGKTGGLAVAIGARIAAAAGPCEVLASQTVRDLTVGSGLRFEDAGEHELKGVPERWRLYRVGTA